MLAMTITFSVSMCKGVKFIFLNQNFQIPVYIINNYMVLQKAAINVYL